MANGPSGFMRRLCSVHVGSTKVLNHFGKCNRMRISVISYANRDMVHNFVFARPEHRPASQMDAALVIAVIAAMQTTMRFRSRRD